MVLKAPSSGLNMDEGVKTVKRNSVKPEGLEGLETRCQQKSFVSPCNKVSFEGPPGPY